MAASCLGARTFHDASRLALIIHAGWSLASANGWTTQWILISEPGCDSTPADRPGDRGFHRPACDTIPVPPPVTSSPFSHPVAFTLRVLLDLDSGKDADTPIAKSQEHFS